MGVQIRSMGMLARRLVLQRPARRVGRPLHTGKRQRGEILAAVYVIGVLGALGAWLADPADVTNPIGMASLNAFALVCAGVLFSLRDRLPERANDAAIAGSLVLITAANLFCRLHVHPGLLTPYYIWVGFASPMWFPRRRAVGYVTLSIVASGTVALVDGTAVAAAAWLVTVAVLVVAFLTVDSLTRTQVERERLAAVGEMASVVSHELRNPLAVLTNSVFLMRHAVGSALNPDLERHLDVADREIDKANAIVDHVVAFVRPRQPQVEPVPLSQVIEEVLETTPLPPGIRVELDTTPVTAVADRGQLAEVLVNLVSNAYEAMTDGGVLTIAAHAAGSSALLAIEDTGCGFDRADAERLFEPFFTTKSSGTGLGLAIVRRLLEVNRAAISVDSHPGRGTRFTVTFPVQSRGLRRTPVPRPAPSTNGAVRNESSAVAGNPPAQRTP